jgi:hypothetical protein
MGSDADKLAAPKLFGRKRSVGRPPEVAKQAAPARDTEPIAEPIKPTRPTRPRRELRLPRLTGPAAAALTGLVVGAFLVLATYGSLRGCTAIRGTSTCGGTAGFPLLLGIGIVAVLIGAGLLRAFRAASPGSDSFLAVALVAVVTTLFLGGHDDAWWMFLVVPILTIGAFALAHWVSVRFIDRAEG